MRTTGTVREWHDDEGWGVIDSPDTPGGCWAHFSVVDMQGYRGLTYGSRVLLDAEDKASGLRALGTLTEDLASGVRRG